jgi:hypothetical protein
LEFSFDLSHVDVLESDFLSNQINGPDADSVVVDSDQLRVCVVEEFNLVSNIHANWISTESFSSLDLFFKISLRAVNRFEI